VDNVWHRHEAEEERTVDALTHENAELRKRLADAWAVILEQPFEAQPSAEVFLRLGWLLAREQIPRHEPAPVVIDVA